MKSWHLSVVLAFSVAAAVAAEPQIRLSDTIVPAPFGYEPAAQRYVVTEATPLYVSPYIYPGTVSNQKLTPGQAVDVLAKVKGYDWILVGKDGLGLGYLPLSRLKPAADVPRP